MRTLGVCNDVRPPNVGEAMTQKRRASARLAPTGVYRGAYPHTNKKHPPRGCFLLEQDTGIEPACSAWEADILPLNYTRKSAFLLYSKALQIASPISCRTKSLTDQTKNTDCYPAGHQKHLHPSAGSGGFRRPWYRPGRTPQWTGTPYLHASP